MKSKNSLKVPGVFCYQSHLAAAWVKCTTASLNNHHVSTVLNQLLLLMLSMASSSLSVSLDHSFFLYCSFLLRLYSPVSLSFCLADAVIHDTAFTFFQFIPTLGIEPMTLKLLLSVCLSVCLSIPPCINQSMH